MRGAKQYVNENMRKGRESEVREVKKKKRKKTAFGRKQPISEKDLNIIRNLSENQIQELFRQSHRNDTAVERGQSFHQ